MARDQPAVAELFDEDAPQYVGETPSTPPSTPQRCAQLSLAMPRPSPATASEYLAPSGRRILEMPGLHGGSASGHQVACLGVYPLPAGRGASWQVFEWSLEVCSRPQSLNSVPTAPIGPILARARVPVCVGRCDRGRRAMGQRRRPDGPCPCGGQRHHHRLWRPLHGPPRPPERGARRVPKIEPAHACTPRNRRERRPPQPPLPPRCPSPKSMPRTA